MNTQETATFKVSISGSFRKHYLDILKKQEEFEACGFVVLSPKASKVLNPGSDFIVLESDGSLSPKEIEQKHLDSIYESDALYALNPGGYIGVATAMEIGWAISFGKPIFFSERCSEDLFNSFGSAIPEATEVRKWLAQRETFLPSTICRFSPLDQLQKYMHKVIVKRGFEKETTRDILLLMIEEVGELAKAIRKFSGLKIDPAKESSRGNLDEELADVFIYLLDLANSCEVDLYSAFAQKEITNEKRLWVAKT